MPSYLFAEKGVAFVHFVGLASQADADFLQAAPTLATGDAKVSIDGGAFANMATLPAVTPAGGKAVMVSWSAAEMNGDNIVTLLSDASGDEWKDVMIVIQTAPFSAADLINAIADSVLRRQMDNVEASSDGDTLDLSSLYGLIQMAQEAAISGGTLTVKKTDGTTTLGTKTVTADANASPITGVS